MIQQVLDRRTLRDFLADMKSEATATLRSPRRRAIAKTPLDDFLGKDLHRLLGDLRQAMKDLTTARVDSQKQRPSRSSFKIDPISDFKAYIPQSPVLSNLQAAI